MLEPMRKHHTDDTVEIIFRGPATMQEEAVRVLEDLGFKEASESTIPWRDAVLYDAEQIPGVCLKGARNREGLTQRQLAELTGIPQRHISEMENGKRSIGKARAKVMAAKLNTDYRVFL